MNYSYKKTSPTPLNTSNVYTATSLTKFTSPFISYNHSKNKAISNLAMLMESDIFDKMYQKLCEQFSKKDFTSALKEICDRFFIQDLKIEQTRVNPHKPVYACVISMRCAKTTPEFEIVAQAHIRAPIKNNCRHLMSLKFISENLPKVFGIAESIWLLKSSKNLFNVPTKLQTQLDVINEFFELPKKFIFTKSPLDSEIIAQIRSKDKYYEYLPDFSPCSNFIKENLKILKSIFGLNITITPFEKNEFLVMSCIVLSNKENSNKFVKIFIKFPKEKNFDLVSANKCSVIFLSYLLAPNLFFALQRKLGKLGKEKNEKYQILEKARLEARNINNTPILTIPKVTSSAADVKTNWRQVYYARHERLFVSLCQKLNFTYGDFYVNKLLMEKLVVKKEIPETQKILAKIKSLDSGEDYASLLNLLLQTIIAKRFTGNEVFALKPIRNHWYLSSRLVELAMVTRVTAQNKRVAKKMASFMLLTVCAPWTLKNYSQDLGTMVYV